MVNEPKGIHKIFDNLVIISNNVEPNSIEIEIYIKDSDTTYKMEQIYKQGVEQFVQFFLNDKFKSSKVEYHEKTKRIKYILFEQI